MKWFEVRIVLLLTIAAMFNSACDGDKVTPIFVDLTKTQLDILFVSESEGQQQIYAVKDSTPGTVYNISKAYGGWGILDPSWSADGRKFAYTDLIVVTSSYAPFHTNIYIRNMDMDSSRYDSLNLRKITTDPYILDTSGVAYGTLNLRPDWNSTTQKIVFISDRIDNKFNIFRIDVTDSLTGDSNSITQLTAEDDKIDIYCYPAFSPNGSTIVYSSSKDGSEEIWKMNADGSN
ncbi:PD40 domain-containing protein, partial [bacterium]|nr:PD40 domain-containing protein [bacterium]